MLRSLACLAILTTGCKQIFGLDEPVSQSSLGDAAMPTNDGSTDGPCASYSTQIDTCMFGPSPPSDLVLSGSLAYNTDTGVLVDGMGAMIPVDRVVVMGPRPIDVVFTNAFRLTPGATLRVTGSRAFGVAASGPMAIEGTLDLAAAQLVSGAGAQSPSACNSSVGDDGQNDAGGAAGGGGGGFHGGGGDGGDGDSNQGISSGGSGGVAIARPKQLIGGCSGGDGGDGIGSGGRGGGAGGAVVLASRTSITISGSGIITAAGGGGLGGDVDGGGGGGGGAGGMILLESTVVTITGTLAANGGGGGEGANGADGNPGQDGRPNSTPASGGSGSTVDGADGADGSGGTSLEGDGVETIQIAGGGGGGGGAGFIAIACPSPSFVSGAVSSPPHAAWP